MLNVGEVLEEMPDVLLVLYPLNKQMPMEVAKARKIYPVKCKLGYLYIYVVVEIILHCFGLAKRVKRGLSVGSVDYSGFVDALRCLQ
ncbi:hypothetical protein scyTo_0003054 [Scyliorhinus torazame]|uniref:Uncharacterized protein n=1 Tax=Scyliorhinus torazame TaxID=75743 RepID=A0A401PLG9_SCYTO|nr:hypothetical protein [Scyliorhinus torazame]